MINMNIKSDIEVREYLISAGIDTSIINEFMNEFMNVTASDLEALEIDGLNLYNRGAKRVLMTRRNPYTKQLVVFGFATIKTFKKVIQALNNRFGGFGFAKLETLANMAVKRAAKVKAAYLATIEAARCSIVATFAAEEVAEIETIEAAIVEAEEAIVEAEEVIVEAEEAIEAADKALQIEENNFDILSNFSLSAGMLCLERQAEHAWNKVRFTRAMKVAQSKSKESRALKNTLQNRVATLRNEFASLEMVKCDYHTVEKFTRNELITPMIPSPTKKVSRKQSNTGCSLEMIELLVKSERARVKKLWLNEVKELRKARKHKKH